MKYKNIIVSVYEVEQDKKVIQSALDIAEKFESIDKTDKILKISAKSGKGVSLLKETIRKCFFKGNLEIGQGPIVTHLRHKAELAKAQESILQAQTCVLYTSPSPRD